MNRHERRVAADLLRRVLDAVERGDLGPLIALTANDRRYRRD